jgi:4-carboxymuconolactone decarboxylase
MFAETRRRFGKDLEPVGVTAHHPTLLSGYSAFELATDRAKKVDARLKDLASTKAALMAGCEFCIDIGSAEARKAGVREEQLRELHSYRDSDQFTEEEKLVLDFAVGMTSTPVAVSDELFDALRKRFDEAQLVELASVIALENYRARFNWAFDIGSQDLSQGAFCPRPEAVGA